MIGFIGDIAMNVLGSEAPLFVPAAQSASASTLQKQVAVGTADYDAHANSGAGPITWPMLGATGLSDNERQARLSGLGGSDANVILSGDRERITRLWLEKRGAPGEDLSDRLQVALGSWTEAFNRQWYEMVTGEPVELSRDALVCSQHPWRRCTLDGFISGRKAVWEAKHTSAFVKTEDVLDRYMPQLQHNMAVAKVERAILSVIFGNHKFEIFEVSSDWLYQLELFAAEEAFWACVKDGSEPVVAPAPPAPKPVGIREVCLDGQNSWAAAAADWLAHRAAAKTHAAACVQIRALVEDDVARAFGHGIEAKRSKSGALTIRELAQ
jgi:predicted phage-related endonuclease